MYEEIVKKSPFVFTLFISKVFFFSSYAKKMEKAQPIKNSEI